MPAPDVLVIGGGVVGTATAYLLARGGARVTVVDAGLIVLGSHGRSRMTDVLIGSVAQAVAAHARRPVLIVHRSPTDFDKGDASS